jgi:hypothetical protein
MQKIVSPLIKPFDREKTRVNAFLHQLKPNPPNPLLFSPY